MIQLIQRNEGHKPVITTIEKGRPQISYNSDGHIVIRTIHDNEKDTLIVLDGPASSKLMGFIRAITQQDHHRVFPF